jgi:hypothetical protein
MNTNQKILKTQQKNIQSQVSKTDAYSFFNLLTSSKLLSVVEAQLPEHRERLYPPTTTLSLFLAQAMNTDSSCQNAVNRHVVERIFNGLPACSIMTGAYCKARQRLPTEMISTLVKQTGQMVTELSSDNWDWKGRQIKLVDGTTISMPDTLKNQTAYPQQSSQKEGLGFPIARMVAVIYFSTGVVLNAALSKFQGKGASEHALFRELMDTFKPGDIVLADRYYASYFLIAALLERNVDIVFQQHGVRKTDFRKGKKLSSRDHVSTWKKPKIIPSWMDKAQYNTFPDEISIRELKAGKKVIITTLLSDKEASKNEIANLYKQRWHVELDLRNIKTTLGMETLSCKTPDMNVKEMWVYFLAYNLIRLVMAEAAFHSHILPRQLSFKHTLQIWLIWSKQSATNNKNIEALLMMIAQIRVGNRPGRIEPRAVKLRPKPFSLLMIPRSEARADILKNGHPKKLK